ncbi:MAG: DNA alkylation repair protein [Bacteroidota bacterium]
MNELAAVLQKLRTMGNPETVEKMGYFGISHAQALGIKIPILKQFVKDMQLKNNHELALSLWEEPIHEAKLLAIFMDDPKQVSLHQMEAWAGDFYSWDIVDSACTQLFVKTPYARQKLWEWVDREEEYIKRAGFVLMVGLAIHDKKAPNGEFEEFLPILEREAWDERNFVKKAVNWTLRQIGKRNLELNRYAIEAAERINRQGSKAARWIASDALRELQSEKIQIRLLKRSGDDGR